MLEILLSDGKKYGLQDLQCRFRSYGIEFVLMPIGMGYEISGLPPNKFQDMDTLEVIDAMNSSKLEPSEKEWLMNLIRFREKLNSFDRRRYDSLKGEERDKYALSFGRECAQIMEEMMKGYETPKGCVSIEHPLEYFISLTKTPMVRDRNTGIFYPFGLNRTE